jgi:hypothetical protein
MVSGLPKHSNTQDADEIASVADATVNGRRNPRTPIPAPAALVAAAIAHGRRALKAKIAAAAWLQAAQVAMVDDPTPTTEATVRRARHALDAGEADYDLSLRELRSYQVRVWQARVAEDVP